MRRPTYLAELARLGDTYESARRADIAQLVELQACMGGRPAIFAASGGSLAVAQLAAEVQSATWGALATAVTPLALVSEAQVRDASVVVISSRASHPDVSFCLAAARQRHSYPVVLVTHRDPASLKRDVAKHLSDTVHIESVVPDGFLATNSVLAMATLFVRAADPATVLPALPWLKLPVPAIETDRVLVLHGPGQRSAAIDLETRLSEIGLASAQVADYRNFAHGRHTGFARNLETTSIVSLAGPATESLAEAVLTELPEGVRLHRLWTSREGFVGALDLLCASMRTVGETATAVGVDPARPRVPTFGRRLYHLSARRHIAVEVVNAVDRKVAAAEIPARSSLAGDVPLSYEAWRRDISATRFGGVVLDYDGTMCGTENRFDGPPADVRSEVIRLLGEGCLLGVATGRGVGLLEEFRGLVPQDLWPSVTMGLYNGAVVVGLGDPAPITDRSVCAELDQLGHLLRESEFATSVKIEKRAWQVSVRPVTGTGLGAASVLRWVREVLARAGVADLKVVQSGHSVDVVAATTSKVTVVERLENCGGKPVLAIGDRGDVDGNDFEMLAARRWSLTVDRCSGDPTRCWNLSRSGRRGPEALVTYLRALSKTSSGWRFRPPRS